MKKNISITLDYAVYNNIKQLRNVSGYIQGLIVADIAEKKRDELSIRTRDDLMEDPTFERWVVGLIDDKMDKQQGRYME